MMVQEIYITADLYDGPEDGAEVSVLVKQYDNGVEVPVYLLENGNRYDYAALAMDDYRGMYIYNREWHEQCLPKKTRS